MDKWQQREAERLAADEGISLEQAAARLFPEGDEQAPAAAPEGDDEQAPAEGDEQASAKPKTARAAK
jgi:hypothetical protein